MIKSPLSSFINLFGLAVAIGICLVVYAFFAFDYSLDQFHKHKDTVFLATFYVDREGSEEQYGTSPVPMGEMLRNDLSQIKKVCRLEDRNVVVKRGDRVFHERVRHVDKEFLEMFTFPLQEGIATSLSDVNSVILSADMSLKYFGDQSPIGQDVQIIFSEENSKTFTVSGVALPFPKARTVDFDFLVNFQNLKVADASYDFEDWTEFLGATLVQVEKPSDISVVAGKMNKYKELQNQAHRDWAISSFEFVSLADLHLRSGNIRDDISFDSSAEARQGLPVIAAIMLLLACLNYVNIAIVSAARRLKEIGLRKVIGANRSLVMVQFLAENVFLTFFAFILGAIMAALIFVPWFSELTGDPLTLDLIDINLWGYVAGILLLTGIASGIYPAFYISKFQAISIFKGTVKFGKKNLLTKVFLGLQLIFTCAGISCAVIFAQNNTYQNSRDWGYNHRQTLYTPVGGGQAYERLQAALLQDPRIKSISGGTHHLGAGAEATVVHLPERTYEVKGLSVDANYFHTMGIDVLDGRAFNSNHESDRTALVVNELFVENLGILDPVGHTLKIDSTQYNIVGVVKNFHMNNFYYELEPTLFRLADKDEYNFLAMRVREGTEMASFASLKEHWAEQFPEIPFQGGFQEDTWGIFFEQLNTAERFYKVIALITVMLATLGLYGLVTLNVAGRTKEFSIRKTLGAGFGNLAALITGQYAVLATTSLIIGVPFSYFMAKTSLDLLYAYSMPVTISGMVISVSLLLLVLVTVLSSQITKVQKANPVEGLRVE